MDLYRDISRLQFGALASVAFIGTLVTWQVLGALAGDANPFLPPPTRVIEDALVLFRDEELLRDIKASVYRVTVGYLLAIMVAIPLGVLAGSVRWLGALVLPFNDFLRYMPVAAFIPLTILWLGIDDPQKFAIIFLGTVFQLLPMVADTVNRIPRHFVDLGYTLGLSSSQIIRRIVVRWSAPEIYDHLRMCLGWAWSYLVVAELVASTTGVGHVIIQSQRFIQTGRVIAGIIVIGVLGLGFDLVFRIGKKRLFPWVE
jgi:NitT/TauT family transport system permease protein